MKEDNTYKTLEQRDKVVYAKRHSEEQESSKSTAVVVYLFPSVT